MEAPGVGRGMGNFCIGRAMGFLRGKVSLWDASPWLLTLGRLINLAVAIVLTVNFACEKCQLQMDFQQVTSMKY